MATQGRADQGVLEQLDSALIRAIKGALWFPLLFLLPVGCLLQLIRAGSIRVLKLLRIGFLLLTWGFVVFGPLMFLKEVRDPDVAMGIVAWSLFATLGSIGGVFRVWNIGRTRARCQAREPGKPEDLKEAFA